MKLTSLKISCLLLLFVGLISISASSQCANNNLPFTTLNPPSLGSTVSNSCVFGGEYVTVNVTIGQTYTFSTCSTLWDTSITLYNNLGGAAIAFNDDSPLCGFQSVITWTATFTGTVRVLIDTWDCFSYIDCAAVSVTWVGSPVGPTSDSCVNAIPIGCGQTLGGNTSTATGETVPLCNPFMSSNTPSLWYSFAGTGQNVTASLCGSSFDTDLTVYAGNCNTLICSAYNDDGCGVSSLVTWFAAAGVTYYIRVAGYSATDFGTFSLNIQCFTGPITASDCINAVDVCTNLSFQIDANGPGDIAEIPPIGSFGNPYYEAGDGFNSPWGTDHDGCLLNDELNSTWMRVNILTSGSLTFTFGGLGTQVGFYDWIMYPYNSSTCNNIYNNLVAPVRCNWNWVSSGGTGLASVIPAGGNALNYEPPLNVLAGQQYIICFSNWSFATTAVPLQFGGTAVVGCQNIALPVELVDFTAKPITNAINVEWATLTEINNDYFVLQRSTDHDNWSEVAIVSGHGNSTEKKYYEFIDRGANAGTNYYRLLQYDFNGDLTTSHIIAASLKFEKDVLYPNPNAGSFTFISGMDSRNIKIFNAQGSLVDFEIKMIDSASNIFRIVLTNPHRGFYILNDATRSKSITFSVN